MKKNIRAFTILEVTITMLIAGLLIALAYTSYLIVIKSYHAFKDKNEHMVMLTGLDHVLARDFDRAEFISKNDSGIILKDKTRRITYTFTPDFVARTSNKTDTFKVQAREIYTAFENIPVTAIQPTEEQNRVDELSFTLFFQDGKIPYHYLKQYSSGNLIKRNPDAIN
jgi:Tfp pilus assembly protein PilE